MPVTQRIRGPKGQFMCSSSSERSRNSLENHRLCQRAYIARRRREKKVIAASFLRDFVVKTDNKGLHWLPGSKDDGPLIECFNNLILNSFQESEAKLITMAKKIYFIKSSDASKKRLPRITVQEATQSGKDGKRVPAFPGWRFPCPTDIMEMEPVEDWLKKHGGKLKVSVGEGRDLCIKVFSRYTKHAKRYRFVGYPVRCGVVHTNNNSHSTTADASNTHGEATEGSIEGQGPMACAGRDNDSEQECLEDDNLLAKAREIMRIATMDTYYRTLNLVLNPANGKHLGILCSVYVSQFEVGKLPEEWCDLQKDIFKFCQLVHERKTETVLYQTLRSKLVDQLETFKLVRLWARLPLYEEEPAAFLGNTALPETA